MSDRLAKQSHVTSANTTAMESLSSATESVVAFLPKLASGLVQFLNGACYQQFLWSISVRKAPRGVLFFGINMLLLSIVCVVIISVFCAILPAYLFFFLSIVIPGSTLRQLLYLRYHIKTYSLIPPFSLFHCHASISELVVFGSGLWPLSIIDWVDIGYSTSVQFLISFLPKHTSRI